MNFGAIEGAAPKTPPGTMLLAPEAFTPGWKGAPDAPVCIGLTLLSEGLLERAKAAAMADAWNLFPRFDDEKLRFGALEDALLRYLIAHGTTDPNDVTLPCELWGEAPEYVIKDALTADGARAIFEKLEALRISIAPTMDEASDDEIEILSALGVAAMGKMPGWQEARVRRLVKFCLDEMLPFVELDLS